MWCIRLRRKTEDIHLSCVPRAGVTDEGPQAEVGAGVSAAEHVARQAAAAPRDLGRLVRASNDRVELVHRVEGAVDPKTDFPARRLPGRLRGGGDADRLVVLLASSRVRLQLGFGQ